MNPLYKKAIKDVTQRKLRAVLTILGIAIGVLGLTAINLTQSQIKSAIQYAQDVSGTPDITYYTSPTSGSLAAQLRQRPNVKVVQTAGDLTTQWTVPNGHKPLEIIGFPDLTHIQLAKFELSSGSMPGPGQILMESSNGTMSPVHVGDRVVVQAGGVPRALTVSGLARTRGRPSSSMAGSGLAYMSLAALQRTFHVPGVNYFLIGLDQYSRRAATAKALVPTFAAHHVTILQAAVGHPEAVTASTDGVLSIMQVLSITALLLSIFLLLSTITTLVTEQVRVIGTMKAIGGTRAAIMRNYLALVGLFGVVGTVVGFFLGLLAAYLLTRALSTTFTLDTGGFSISTGTVLLAVLVGVGVPLLAAVLPIYLGTRITVHDALTGYGLTSGGMGSASRHTGWARATARILSIAPQSTQVGIRNVFRRRTRALLTLLALSISGAAFLSVQSTSTSLNSAITHVFDNYNFQVLVEFSKPHPYATVHRLIRGVPGVSQTESFSQIPVTTRWGTATLTGGEPGTQLYRKDMVSGRWFTADDRNVVVISKSAADSSHLRVGETLRFHDDLHAASWRVIGIAIDNSGIGQTFGVMLAPLTEVNAFRGLPRDMTTAVLVASDSRDQRATTALSARIDSRLAAAGLTSKIQTMQEFRDAVMQSITMLGMLLYAVAIIIALVGAIGLFNTLAMSVLERRREIGILRSMGATGRKVAGVFWAEGISLGVIAWMVGILIGIPAAYGFVQLLGSLLIEVPFVFSPVSLVLMLVFILAVATLASVAPVWRAARVHIAQTLRYEG